MGKFVAFTLVFDGLDKVTRGVDGEAAGGLEASPGAIVEGVDVAAGSILLIHI